MRKVFCDFLCIIGIVMLCVSCNSLPIKGSGELVTLEKSISAFEKINCSSTADVRFYISDIYRTVVTVDSNLDEYVEISSENNVLNIRAKRGQSYKFTKFIVEVYSPVLTGVSIAGSGSFNSVDKILTSTFTTDISGSGTIEGTVYSDDFFAKILGSGRITIVGTCQDAKISIAGSGTFSGNEFDIKNATVNISGSGTGNFCVSDGLNATISGSGNINYRGEPKIDSSIAGSGKIRKM